MRNHWNKEGTLHRRCNAPSSTARYHEGHALRNLGLKRYSINNSCPAGTWSVARRRSMGTQEPRGS